MRKKILALIASIFFLLSFALFAYSLSVTLDLNPSSGDEPLDVTLTATIIAGTQIKDCWDNASCGTEENKPDLIKSCGTCTINDTMGCTMANGCAGTQTCNTSQSWDPCEDTFPDDNCPGIIVEQLLPEIQECPVCTNGAIVNCATSEDCPGLHTCSDEKWSSCTSIIDECPSAVPTIAVEDITPYEDITVVQNQAFTFTTKVSCYGGTCGDVTAILDPTLTFQEGDGGTYSTTYDNHIRSGVSSNYGTYTYIWVHNLPIKGLIIFPDVIGNNAGQISPGSIIESAELELTQFSVDTGDKEIGVYMVTDPSNNGVPSETQSHWFERKTGTDWDTGGGDYDPTPVDTFDAYLSDPVGTKYYADVTSAVQAWSNGYNSKNDIAQGFILEYITGFGTIYFKSSEYFHAITTITERPKLSVTYREPKGVIPMNVGDPFYTTNQNPQNSANTVCLQNMQEGDTCINTWSVMPTGATENTYTFFVDYVPQNGTAKKTTELNITIKDPPSENCVDVDGDSEDKYDPINCSRGTDCDDSDTSIKSGTAEVCDNLVDDNCDGKIDEDCPVCIDSVNVLQNEFFTFATKITCFGDVCGNVTATLDPKINSKINAVSDGGYAITAPPNLYLSNFGSDYIDFGYQKIAGFRFNNINIPPEAGIVSAKLVMKAELSSGDFVNVVIKAEKSDNPITFTTYIDFIDRPKTQNFVEWNNVQPFTQEFAAVYSPDLWPIIQELIDSPNWDQGDNIVIFIEDNGSTTNVKRRVFDWEVGAEGRAATLEITYQADKKDKGGTIPMNAGNPFYTTSQNPQNSANNACLQNMQDGDICYNTWDVNATGKTNNPFTFFVDYASDSPDITAQTTPELDITIVTSENCVSGDADGIEGYDPINCSSGTDCDDNNDQIYPGATEICDNGIDEDCDWEIDEGCPSCTEDWECDPFGACEEGMAPFNYEWDFGDGSLIEITGDDTPWKSHTYMAGYYTPKVTVSDMEMRTGEATKELSVSAGGNFPPTADAGGPYYTTPNDPDPEQLDGSGSLDPEGAINYEWTITATKGSPNCVADNTTIINPTVTCSESGTAEVKLTVTDTGGKTDSDTTTIKSSLTQTDDLINIVMMELLSPEKLDPSMTDQLIATRIYIKNETDTQYNITLELKIIEAEETNPQTVLTYDPWSGVRAGPGSFETMLQVGSISHNIWKSVLTPGKDYWLEATITADGEGETDTTFNTKKVLFSYVKESTSQGLTLSETSLALLILIIMTVLVITGKKQKISDISKKAEEKNKK